MVKLFLALLASLFLAVPALAADKAAPAPDTGPKYLFTVVTLVITAAGPHPVTASSTVVQSERECDSAIQAATDSLAGVIPVKLLCIALKDVPRILTAEEEAAEKEKQAPAKRGNAI